jgi:hypothetical protein
MTNLINTAYALIESGDAQSKAHGQGMLEVIQNLPPCLNWSAQDFERRRRDHGRLLQIP